MKAHSKPKPNPAATARGPATLFVPTPLSPRDVAIIVALSVAALALYGWTTCRTIFAGDSAELSAATALFGVAHPPGYPLFTMVTGGLMRLVPLDPAFASNLATSLEGALAVGALALLMRRMGASLVASCVAAAAFALGRTFWSASTAIEVYAFDALLFALAMHAALGLGSRDRSWIGAAMFGGLWLGHRPINLAYLPFVIAIGVVTGVVRRDNLARLLPAGALAVVLPYAYLPLASRRDPGIDIGDPETFERFMVVVRGAPYVRHWMNGSFAQAVSRFVHHLAMMPVELGLGAIAAVAALKLLGAGSARRRIVVPVAGLVVTNWLVASAYHVLDTDVFFLPSTVALALLAAQGFDLIRVRFNDRATVAWAMAAGVVVLLPINFRFNDRSELVHTRLMAEDNLASAPQDSMIIVGGDSAIHSLWYLQAVEHQRPDVLVFSPGHVHPWYLDQLRKRFPSEPWPAYGAAIPDQTVMTRQVIDRMIGHRPVMATQFSPIAPHLGPTGDGPGYGVMPRGLLQEVARVGTELQVRERVDWTMSFFTAAMARYPRRDPSYFEFDTSSIQLEYALALSRSADLLAMAGEREGMEQLSKWSLELEPDRLERRLAEDFLSIMGERKVFNELAKKAEDRRRRVDAAAASRANAPAGSP